ncbi:lasso RiPP family leader peptide-containing protein [Dyadobacter sp.]|uniref:lasso RiPP family leader peptide-containing protein n=1 Tax=Dyadobacter sp. TaxID=1914288 RepID=UPI003F6EA505
MKLVTSTESGSPIRKSYQKPQLRKLGSVVQLTKLGKLGSNYDDMTGNSDFSAD